MKYILAIDQGTTGSRACVYDRSGKIAASSYMEFSQHFPKPGWVEHDPAEIWNSVRSSIDKALLKIPAREICAIGITNQRETTVVWDRFTGKPVYPAIVWQCRRTASRCEMLNKMPGMKKFVSKRTGLPIDAYFSATKIEWILRNVPGASRKAAQGRLVFGTTDTWILWNLTAGAVHATDYTNASRTMLFNINDLEWDSSILDKFDIPASVLPSVKRSSGLFGFTAVTGRLPAGIPISGIAGDQQAALFGQACFSPGTVKNTYGTGAFMLMNIGKKIVFSENGLITTIACGPDGGVFYALEGSIFIAGAAVQWLRDGLKIIKKASESQRTAESAGDNAGVYFVPALAGLGAPYWNAKARGTITGLTRGTTGAHIVRAALESICYQTKDVLDCMESDSGLKISELKVDGGAAKNDFLLQFQADILGVKVVRPRIIESTSLGAAYLAGLAVGFWKDPHEIAKCWKKDRAFKPKMKKNSASNLYAVWKKAVAGALAAV